ncbi:thioredoxin family protein [Salinirubrum litoreum]|uniref:Thioredoxin family protein n=1 Tax=Salinirubrum litoreum TaxID=1126234 RepID=A0ABD5R9D3_9EURY|nr:thioredoxin family protein [Salinirubrum litoreum]
MVAAESLRIVDENEEAPSFELPGTDGETYTLDSFADNDALLIVFTCNHCPYAKAKEGALNAIAADYDDVAVVGINPNDAEQYPDDSGEKMREYVESGRIAFDAYLRDESQSVAAAYGAVCTPDPFLFRNDDGTFRLAYHGRLDDALNPDADPSGEPGFEMRRAIDSVLAGESVALDWHASRGCSIKWREGNEPDYWDDL